jgi:hypothetical protein
MKSIFGITTLAFSLGSIALAGPVTPCATDTLSDYISNSAGCSVGNLAFSGFAYIGVTAFANPIDATDITVTPTDAGGVPELTFSANWTASGLISASESLITFSATSLVGGIDVTSIGLSDTGAVSGLGTATVAEVDCFGGLLNPNTPSVACLGGGVGVGANANITGTNLSANALIPFASAVPEVDVIKDITLATGVVGSSAVSSVTQDFNLTGTASAVPEPRTMVLAGFGLAALLFAGRRRKSSRLRFDASGAGRDLCIG